MIALFYQNVLMLSMRVSVHITHTNLIFLVTFLIDERLKRKVVARVFGLDVIRDSRGNME